jgi:hypothetical protein
MRVGERLADESNRRRSTALPTACAFVLAGNALIPDRRVITICRKYGLRRYATWRLIGISDDPIFDPHTGKCSRQERQIPETLLWRMSLT